jgi:hypothetical protein
MRRIIKRADRIACKMLEIFKNWKCPEGKSIVLMGSCFSDNLKPFLEEKDFRVTSNVFGTLFHPIPIFNWLKYACANGISEDEMQLVFHEEMWKSLGGGKVLRLNSKEELKELIHSKLNVLHEELKSADTLVITLGTAHAWIHEEFGVVGNCQRLPQQKFKQELISLDEMIRIGKETICLLKQFNSDLKIVFTVSPVKHWRMGVVENARTKARCMELAHVLCEMTNSVYFPSYEFISDVLRSDEYFEVDRCHPNEKAIALVAENFLK